MIHVLMFNMKLTLVKSLAGSDWSCHFANETQTSETTTRSLTLSAVALWELQKQFLASDNACFFKVGREEKYKIWYDQTYSAVK